MRIKSVRLRNFKRFTDLRLDAIPDSAKLVLLIGANGSGKSSVFDAFEYLSRRARGMGNPMSEDEAAHYFRKGTEPERVDIEMADRTLTLWAGSMTALAAGGAPQSVSIETARRFYGRSALRVPPRIASVNYSRNLSEVIDRDQDSPATFIDLDNRLFTDAVKYSVDFNQALRQPVFEGKQVDISAIAQSLIAPMNDALKRVFASLGPYPQMINFREPESPGQPLQFYFRKGDHEFSYDLLSFGEKQVFAVLLNLFVRKTRLDDAIIYIDELDLHLNTSLQHTLLGEIVEHWIPEGSQFWTASHSLGFIRYATRAANAVIFDLNALDFDLPQLLLPAPKQDSEILQVAVPAEFLPDLFVGKRLVFCEGNDDIYYNSLRLPNTIFAKGGNKPEVYGRARHGQTACVIDRDYLTDAEVAQLEQRVPCLRILRHYSIENYLYHPDNLAEVNEAGYDRSAYIQALTAQKNAVGDDLIFGIAKARDSYPFRRDTTAKEYEASGRKVAEHLASDDFERYYPLFPMKDHATQLAERQNIGPKRLAGTRWFAERMQDLLRGIEVFKA